MAADEVKKLNVTMALTKSLVADLEKRRSRFGYSTSYATTFDKKKRPALDKYWNPLEKRWMVSQWHIAKVLHLTSHI